MKNRKLHIFLALFMFLILPLKVEAGSFSLTVSCGSVTVGKVATCDIKGTVSGTSASGARTSVSGFQANYSISGGTFNSFTVGSGWSGEGDRGKIELYTDTNKTGTFAIGTLKINASKVGNITLSITNIGAADEDFVEIGHIANVTRTINVKNTTTTTSKKPNTTKKTSATTRKLTTTKTPIISSTTITTSTTASNVELRLTSVTVDDYEVSYEDGKYYATTAANDSEVMISATAANGITIIGVGSRSLTTGKNVVDLILRSPSGQTSTVQVIITKPAGDNLSTELSDLKVVNQKLEFDPSKREFTVSVPFYTKEIYVIATPKNPDATVANAGTHSIKNNTEEIIISVGLDGFETTNYKLIIKKNYNLILLWIGVAALGAGGMFIYFRIKSSKNKEQAEQRAAINKEKANVNRREISEGQAISLNGERNSGVGRRMVAPTPVMAASAEENPLDKQPTVVKQVVKPTQVSTTQQAPVAKQVVVKKAPVQVVSSAPEAQVKVETANEQVVNGTYGEEDIVIKDF